jgi:hypothetical protein
LKVINAEILDFNSNAAKEIVCSGKWFSLSKYVQNSNDTLVPPLYNKWAPVVREQLIDDDKEREKWFKGKAVTVCGCHFRKDAFNGTPYGFRSVQDAFLANPPKWREVFITIPELKARLNEIAPLPTKRPLPDRLNFVQNKQLKHSIQQEQEATLTTIASLKNQLSNAEAKAKAAAQVHDADRKKAAALPAALQEENEQLRKQLAISRLQTLELEDMYCLQLTPPKLECRVEPI